MKTIVGLYGQAGDATKAIQALENAGFSASSVRVLRSVSAMWQHLGCTPGKIMATDFAMGAVLGIALYSLFGVLVAVGEVTLGFEHTTAIGALLIFAVAGMFVGGLLGAFFGLGNLEQESRLYVAGIRRGGALVVVRTADEHAARAMEVLRQTNAEGVKICWRSSDHPAQHGLPRPKDRLSLWSRWVARGLGIALILLVLLFFIGDGLVAREMSDLLTMSLVEAFLFLTLLMTLLGIVVAWRWEAIGSLLILGSVLLFESVNAVASGYWRVGVLDPLFILVGLLFLWDGWRTSGGARDHPSATSV